MDIIEPITEHITDFQFTVNYEGAKYSLYTYDKVFISKFYSSVCIAVKHNGQIGYIPCLPLDVATKAKLKGYISPLRFYYKNTIYCFLFGAKTTDIKSLDKATYTVSTFEISTYEPSKNNISDVITVDVSTSEPQLFSLRKKIYIKNVTDTELYSGALTMTITNTELCLGSRAAKLYGGEYESTITVDASAASGARTVLPIGYSKVKFAIVTDEDETIKIFSVSIDDDGYVRMKDET